MGRRPSLPGHEPPEPVPRVAYQMIKGIGMIVQTKGAVPVPFSEFEPEVRKEIASSAVPEVRIRPLSPGDEEGLHEMLGHAMYARQEARKAEMAIVVEDRWQSRGIGRLLLGCLTEEARRRGIESLTGTVLGENRDALRFFSSVLLKAKFEIKDGMYNLHLPLVNPDPTQNLSSPGG